MSPGSNCLSCICHWRHVLLTPDATAALIVGIRSDKKQVDSGQKILKIRHDVLLNHTGCQLISAAKISDAPPAEWRQSLIHSTYYLTGVRMAERMGMIVDKSFNTAARMMPLLEALPLMDAMQVQTEPMLGWQLGSLIPAAAHGAVGYATVSSANVGQAMQTIARYIAVRNRLFDYRFSTDSSEAVLSLIPNIPLRGYQEFCEIATAVSLFNMVQDVVDSSVLQQIRFEAAWSASSPVPANMNILYGREISALFVPAEVANMPLITADPRLYESACRSLEEELASIDGSMAARIRKLMPDENQHWPSLSECAGRMCISERTLARKLALEGYSFQSLLDESKCELACWLLSYSPHSISVIAERLGYDDDKNFSRSFRRWRNTTPREYRQQRAQ